MRDFVVRRVCAFSIVTGLVAGAVVWLLIVAEARTDRVRVEAAAEVAAEHARWTLETAHLILRQIDTLVETRGERQPGPEDTAWQRGMRDVVARTIKDFPVLRGLLVVDANGWFVLDEQSTAAETRLYLGDRDYFRAFSDGALRESRENGLFVGNPVVGRRSGKWFFSMSRAVEWRPASDGTAETAARPDAPRFAGVVAGVLDPEFFYTFFEQQKAGHGPEILLINRQGMVVAGSSRAEGREPAVGQRISPGNPGAAAGPLLGLAQRGAMPVRLFADEPPVLAALAEVPGFGYYALAVLPTGTGPLPPWSRPTAIAFAIWLLATVGATLFFLRDAAYRRTLVLQNRRISASEQKFRLIYQNTPVMLHGVDGNGCLVEASAHWLRRLGYREDEVIGRPLSEFLTEPSRRYAREILSHEFYGDGMARDAPLQYVTRDGEIVDVLLSANGERDPEGRLQRSLAVSVDVTEQLRAERALWELLKAIPDFMFELSDDLRFVRSHGADTSGLFGTADVLIGRPLPDVLRAPFADPFVAAHREAVASGTLQAFEFERPGTGGEMGTFAVRMVPRRGGGTLGIMRDITVRRHAEARLKRRTAELARSNADLQEFAYIASHDLRAPLRGISHLLVWLAGNLGEQMPGEAGENLKLLRDRIDRLERMLCDFLEYTRAGRLVAAPEWIDVGSLVQEVVHLLEMPGGFRVTVPPDLPRLYSPRAPLEQVLRNLIGNAVVHHDGVEGQITIAWHDRGEMIEFVISDDGPGIAPADHGRIFRLFQTLRDRERGGGGSGVGLAIVRRLVDSQGGRVWVESDGETRGASFHFEWCRQYREVSVEGD